MAAQGAPAVIPRWLPNALSVLRIALVPVWLVLALAEPPRRVALIALLLVIGATDMLDGLRDKGYSER
jgi:phosphatidylglycerophosphate synthase